MITNPTQNIKKITGTEFTALCSLIADASHFSLATLSAQLKNLLIVQPEWNAYLQSHQELLLTNPNLNKILNETHWEKIEQVIIQWAEHPFELSLEEGLYTFSYFADATTLKSDISDPLNNMGKELHFLLQSAETPEEVIKIFNQYIFGELGFHGDHNNYYNPDNSYIHKVLATRTGIPIALASICLLIAKRVHWKGRALPLVGIGMPLHFILQFKFESKTIFIDPFNRGKILTYKNCTDFLKDNTIVFKPQYLLPVNNHAILCRTLANLLNIYSNLDDHDRRDQVLKYLNILKGENEL